MNSEEIKIVDNIVRDTGTAVNNVIPILQAIQSGPMR